MGGPKTRGHVWQKLRSRIDEALERQIPEELAVDIEKQRRAQVLVGSSWVLAFSVLLALVLRLAIGDLSPVTTVLCLLATAVFLAAPKILSRTGSLPFAGILILVALHVLVLVAAWAAGGISAPATSFLPLLPFLAIFGLGPRAGWTSAGLLFLGCLLMVLLPSLGWVAPPLGLSPAEESRARVLTLGVALLIASLWGILADRQRRKADHQWRTAHERYRRMFENSHDAVVVTDPEGQLIDANPTALQLYGYRDLKSMAARNVREIYIDPGERARLLEILEDEGFVRSHETYQRNRQGELLVIQGTTTVLRDSSGRIEYLLSILRDVTRVRKARADKEALLGELAAKNRDLERFTTTVSHDLKSPLITIRGFLGFLEKDVRAGNIERIGADMDRIKNAVDHMDRVLDDLLDLSRLDGGVVVPEPLRLSEVVSEVENLLMGKSLELGVRIENELQVETVVADRKLLRLILQNLIENAIKFSAEADDPRVRVVARARGGKLICSVQDHGVGIPSQDQKKIFDLFERLDTKSSGTGIGLANVRRAVDLQYGDIWVESAGEGRGSTFYFTLPLDLAEVQASMP